MKKGDNMKKGFIAILLLLVLMACQQRVPEVPAPQQQAMQAYPAPAGMAYWDYEEESARHIMKDQPMLGPSYFKIYAYGAKEAKSALPNTPLEYRVYVTEKKAGNPPLEPSSELTIMLTSIKSDGSMEIYGTPNVPQVHPNNFLRYDKTEGAWTTQRGLAQNDIGPQRFIVLVNHKGYNKLIRETLNVR